MNIVALGISFDADLASVFSQIVDSASYLNGVRLSDCPAHTKPAVTVASKVVYS